MTDQTPLRSVSIIGPRMPAATGVGTPIWQLSADVVYDNGDGLTLVDRNPAIRTLALGVDQVKVTYGSKTAEITEPLLLKARLDLEREATLKPPIGNTGGGFIPKADGAAEVVLAPAVPWPTTLEGGSNKENGTSETPKFQITVPTFALAAGGISMWLPLDGYATFLNYNQKHHTVFGGAKLLRKHPTNPKLGPFVRLVPEGVEFDVRMPNPLVDLAAKKLDPIAVTIRIEPGPKAKTYRARLIGPAETGATDGLLDLLRDAFASLVVEKSPLRIDLLDRDLTLPPLRWHLHPKGGKLQIAPPDPNNYELRADLDPALIRMRVETAVGANSQRPAIAHLTEKPLTASLQLTRETSKSTLSYGVGLTENGELDGESITAKYSLLDPMPRQTNPRLYALKQVTSEPMAVYAPFYEAAERTSPRENADGERFVFLPVAQGTLQLSVPKERPGAEGANPELREAFEGNCIFQFKAVDVEVDASRAAKVSIDWTKGQSGTVSIALGQPRGALRRCLWSAEESPTTERLLPTGRRDPAASREINLVFGGERSSNGTLEFRKLAPSDGSWRLALNLPEEQRAILWRNCPDLPLVSAAQVLSRSTVSGPSELRSLVPIVLQQTPTLTASASDHIPGVADETKIADNPRQLDWPWPNSKNETVSIALVSPTTPGVEYALTTDKPFGVNDSMPLRIAMRYDLPVLDELFAASRPPPEEDPDQIPVALDAPAMAVGVNDLVATVALWKERAMELAMTRTQVVRATEWIRGFDTFTAGPLDLVQPYDVDAEVSFAQVYDLKSGPVPLGSYSIDWGEGRSELFSGDKALLGLGGETPLKFKRLDKTKKLVRSDAGDVEVTGFAPALYKVDGLATDTRGAGLGGEAGLDKSKRRRRPFAVVDGAKGVLFTPCERLVLRLGGEEPQYFWARDLPLIGGVFDGATSPLEGRLGPDAYPFERGNVVQSLYEWRVYAGKKEGRPARYDFTVGDLRVRPLRLWRFELDVSLTILCSATLATGKAEGQPSAEPFADDRPYGAGLLVLLRFENVGGELSLKTVQRIRLMEGAKTLADWEHIDDNHAEFALTARLVTKLGTLEEEQKDDAAVHLTGTITNTGELADAAIDVRILGQDHEIAGTLANGEFTGRPQGPDDSVDHLHVVEATLMLSDSVLSLRLVGTVLLDPDYRDPKRPPSPWLLRISETDISWLGSLGLIAMQAAPASPQADILDGGISTVTLLLVDHVRGAIQLVSERKPDAPQVGQFEPLTGLKLDEITSFAISFTLIVEYRQQKPKDKNGFWAITSGGLQAQVTGKSGTAPVALRSIMSRWTDKDGKVTNRSDLWLDCESGFAESAIVWDPDGLTVTAGGPDNQPGHVIVETAPTEGTWLHSVRTLLDEHPIPVASLASDNGRPRLMRNIPLTVRVEHRLVRGTVVRSWTSIESVSLTSAPRWREEDDDEVKYFGPRYRVTAAKYRGKTTKDMTVAGIGPRKYMLSGFDDPILTDALKGTDDDTLLLVGGSPSLHRGDTVTLFSLPWLVALDGQQMPEALGGLMTFDKARTWRAARLDATISTIASDAFPKALNIPFATVKQLALLDALAPPRTSTTDSWMDHAAAVARAVQQAFIEPQVETDQPTSHRAWPLFVTALVALKQILADSHPMAEGSVVSLHVRPGTRDVVLVRIEPPPSAGLEEQQASRRAPNYILRAFSRIGESATVSLDNPTGAKQPVDLIQSIGTARLRDIATALLTNPNAAVVEVLMPDHRAAASRGLELPADFLDFGRPRMELRHLDEAVYPSPALGWAERGHDANAHSMRGSADTPVISIVAGLAARSASLGLDAVAFAPDDAARYIASQARAAFNYGPGSTEHIVSGPSVLNLTPLPPRVRTPTEAAREEGMARAGAGTLDTTAGLLPPLYSRSLIGERPGVVETVADAVLVEGNSNDLDADYQRFGRSATIAPAILRQVRMPRSPALPTETSSDLELRRRTYVSRADVVKNEDPLAKVLACSVPATMWRHCSIEMEAEQELEDRFILELHTTALDPATLRKDRVANRAPALALRVRYRAWHWERGPTPVLVAGTLMQALAKTGFLDNSEKSAEQARRDLVAWLSIGERRFYAAGLDWSDAVIFNSDGEATLPVNLLFSPGDIDQILTFLDQPDPDISANLHFTFAPPVKAVPFPLPATKLLLPPSDTAEPQEGPPHVLVLPIGRIPQARPALDIVHHTFIFADPAFDRVLATPALTSSFLRVPGAVVGDNVAEWMLAADRVEYDVASTVYFAFGELVGGRFAVTPHPPELTVRFTLLPRPEPGKTPTPFDLHLDGWPGKKEYGVTPARPYAVAISRLTSAAGHTPRPGDRLEINVTGTALEGPTPAVSPAKVALSIGFTLAVAIENPSPAAVYSIVTLSRPVPQQDAKWSPRTLLHASAPPPDRIEFVDLLNDLAKGRVRRRAIFQWRGADIRPAVQPESYATIVKTDRSGGAQLPRDWSDFVSVQPTATVAR